MRDWLIALAKALAMILFSVTGTAYIVFVVVMFVQTDKWYMIPILIGLPLIIGLTIMFRKMP